MLKMYGEHHTVGVEVEPEDLQSVYMVDYGAEKRPVPLERKADPPRPARVVSPFLYRNPPFRWNVSGEHDRRSTSATGRATSRDLYFRVVVSSGGTDTLEAE